VSAPETVSSGQMAARGSRPSPLPSLAVSIRLRFAQQGVTEGISPRLRGPLGRSARRPLPRRFHHWIPTSLCLVHHRARLPESPALQCHRESYSALGDSTASRSVSRRSRSHLSDLRQRFDLLREGRRSHRVAWPGAQADRLSKSMAERNGRAMGGQRPAGAAGPRDHYERAAPAAAALRIRRLLQRRSGPHPAERFTGGPVDRASAVAERPSRRLAARGWSASPIHRERGSVVTALAHAKPRTTSLDEF